MSIRVGYVNVQGLSGPKWQACLRLLADRFDYLLLAETWFVEYDRYSQDRRFLAASIRGTKSTRGSRENGGIYLLGNQRAASQMTKL